MSVHMCFEEHMAKMYWYSYKIETVIARIFIHMSPGGTEHLSLQNFASQIAQIEDHHNSQCKEKCPTKDVIEEDPK